MSIGSKIMQLQVGDKIRVNNWARALTVCGVSENYVLAHCGGREYTVIGKKPTREFYNGIPYGSYVCGPDYFTFGYPGGYDFENEEWVKKYLDEFERGSIEMSVRHRAQIISLEREGRPFGAAPRMELKRCPFCGGKIEGVVRREKPMEVRTNATCINCWMEFVYVQDFAFSKAMAGIAPLNASFEEAFNRRIGDDLPERMVDDGK